MSDSAGVQQFFATYYIMEKYVFPYVWVCTFPFLIVKNNLPVHKSEVSKLNLYLQILDFVSDL